MALTNQSPRNRHQARAAIASLIGGVLAVGVLGACASSGRVDRGTTARAADEDVTAPRPRELAREKLNRDYKAMLAAERAIGAQAARIQEECRELATRTDLPGDHWSREWAGVYSAGGVTMCIAPDAGVTTYTWYGCSGTGEGNQGTVTGTFDCDADRRVDGVNVRWTLNEQGGLGYSAEKLYFVRWDGPHGGEGRQYLVPEDRMMDLVNGYNEGGYARDVLNLAPRKVGSLDDVHYLFMESGPPVIGQPHLPARWAKLLLNTKLTARVVGTSDYTSTFWGESTYVTEQRVRLDKGRADGVYVGMVIHLTNLHEPGEITIDRIEDGNAEGLYRTRTGRGVAIEVPDVGDTVHVGQDDGVRNDAEGA